MPWSKKMKSSILETRWSTYYLETKKYLVKDSAIQAKELNIHGLILLAHGANMEHLAWGLQVCVVATDDFASAREVGLRQIVEVQVLEGGE